MKLTLKNPAIKALAAKLEADIAANSAETVKAFFTAADLDAAGNPDARVESIVHARKLAGEWGMSVRDAAKLAGRENPTAYQRHFTVAKAWAKYPNGAQESGYDTWESMIRECSLRDLVSVANMLRDEHGDGPAPKSDTDKAQNAIKGLIRRLETLEATSNAVESMTEYLTQRSGEPTHDALVVKSLLHSVKVKTPGQAIREMPEGDQTGAAINAAIEEAQASLVEA